MKSSYSNPNPTAARAGNDTQEAAASKGQCGPHFFIRADGQYFVSQLWTDEEAWTLGGMTLMKTTTHKIRTAVLGFFPDGKATILRLDEFFLN